MKRSILIAGMVIVLAHPLSAQESPTFKSFDVDQNGLLDPAEFQKAKTDLAARSDQDSNRRRAATVTGVVLADQNGNYSVVALEAAAGVGTLACDPGQRVFVRAALQGVPLGICAPTGEGLTFGAQDNRETDVSTVTIDGGIGMRLMDPERPAGARYGLFAFLEGHNITYSSEEEGTKGQIRLGLQGEMDTEFRLGEIGTYLELTASPYAMTDAKLEAKGYGITASVVPTVPDWRLNARKSTEPYWFTTILAFDYLDVDDGGVSGLANDTEYFWAEATLGYNYLVTSDEDTGRNGYRLGLTGTYARDLINDKDYSQILAVWNIFLDPKQHTSIKVQYQRGETRLSPVFQDVATIGLSLNY